MYCSEAERGDQERVVRSIPSSSMPSRSAHASRRIIRSRSPSPARTVRCCGASFVAALLQTLSNPHASQRTSTATRQISSKPQRPCATRMSPPSPHTSARVALCRRHFPARCTVRCGMAMISKAPSSRPHRALWLFFAGSRARQGPRGGPRYRASSPRERGSERSRALARKVTRPGNTRSRGPSSRASRRGNGHER